MPFVLANSRLFLIDAVRQFLLYTLRLLAYNAEKLAMKRLLILLLIGFQTIPLYAADPHYEAAFSEIQMMLKGEQKFSFKRAVFVTENAFNAGKLDYAVYTAEISQVGGKLKQFIRERNLTSYKTAGNFAAFTFMTDSVKENGFQPYRYDFDDFMGDIDWQSMFVTKLMRTKKGNCHSLPYFYKIICDEIGAEAFLAMAPNHVYIKHKDEAGQWVNVELTSGGFPRDQWMIQQMAISVESIKSNAYMTPLSEIETLAMCLFDLAENYEKQFGYDEFLLKVVEEGLKYYPNSIQLTMQKSNYYGMMAKQLFEANLPLEAKRMYGAQTSIIERMNTLGHKQMPPELYEQWVKSVEEEKAKLKKAEP